MEHDDQGHHQDRPDAYSNPIYGEVPIPKPRYSKTKKTEIPKIEIPPEMLLPPPPPSHDKRSSSLDLGDIRMTQLLEEINSLTDSLQKSFSLSCSEPMVRVDSGHNENKTESPEYTTTTTATTTESQNRTTLSRKRVPVRSDLLYMSFEETVAAASTVTENGKPVENGSETMEKPPELPPRKPLLRTATMATATADSPPLLSTAVKTITETLTIEHLHTDTLSLQRSGYLWKTGPNYRSFKNRWCVLYRHSQNFYDANISYYFNRSSMSASLSGKILLAEIEFIAVCETIPAKTRLPKIGSMANTNTGLKLTDYNNGIAKKKSDDPSTTSGTNFGAAANNQTLAFFEIGVKCRQGRVYLLAARSETDRDQWIHAFVQAITLHAFKNKQIYHCGFVRAKFTVTAAGWQTCFALLTTDRFLYVFEMMADSSDSNDEPESITSIDCKRYHVYNLRKTCRLSRMDDSVPPELNVAAQPDPATPRLTDSPMAMDYPLDSNNQKQQPCCKSGFSLTLNGGHVVYLSCLFESHIKHWYRSVWKFWQTPRQPAEKLTLEEQYLTGDNIPVAFDKCVKFLDTFNQTGLDLFGQENSDSMGESELRDLPPAVQVPAAVAGSQKRIANYHPPLTGSPSAPVAATSGNIRPAEMDLWQQHQLLVQLRFDSWNVHLLPQKYHAKQIASLLLNYFRSMNECLFTEQLLPYWARIATMDPVDAAAAAAAVATGSSPNHRSMKNEQIKRLLRLMPPVNYATLRRLIIYLANNSNNKEVSNISGTLCRTLFFSKRSKAPVISACSGKSLLVWLIQNHVWLFDVTKEEQEKELHIKRVVNMIINQNRKENAKKQQQQPHPVRMKMFRSLTSEHLFSAANNNHHNKHHHHHRFHYHHYYCPKRVNSLIIGIKVLVPAEVDNNKNNNGQQQQQSRTINVHINRDTTASDVLDMVREKVKLPEEAVTGSGHYSVFELICNRRLERIIPGREPILPVILHWSYWPDGGGDVAGGLIEVKPAERLLRGPERKRIRLPNLNGPIRFGPGSAIGQPPMLMSVVRYCHQTAADDIRLVVKHILAEFSSSQMFLYCKETHHMLGQFSLDDIQWYVGLTESAAAMFRQQSAVKCSDLMNDEATEKATSSHILSGTGNVKPTTVISPYQHYSTTTKPEQQPVPGLTFIERDKMKQPQPITAFLSSFPNGNFGHTLLFGSHTELDQWIKGLLDATFYKELYS